MKSVIFIIKEGMKGGLDNIQHYENLKGSSSLSEEDRLKTLNDLYNIRDDCYEVIKMIRKKIRKDQDENDITSLAFKVKHKMCISCFYSRYNKNDNPCYSCKDKIYYSQKFMEQGP